MSDALEKAEAAVARAEANTDVLEVAKAALELAKAAQAQQAAAPVPVHRQEFDAKKWLVVGGVVVSVGLAGALFALAIAIAACCGTGCFLILRSIWTQTQKGK
jgi:hypothetical protein